ncbi:MAG TPA: coproporphyrinogen dehydrogenase HemZ [Ruminococcaceae bacterium]|nr:coproporphyrinogen dehydrogenase HemZ [Oscillospiraceae bacterium]
MNIYILNHPFHYEIENICRMFYPNEDIKLVYEVQEDSGNRIITEIVKHDGFHYRVFACVDGKECAKQTESEECENEKAEYNLALCLYCVLTQLTGVEPVWGMLTGVRPSKLMNTLVGEIGEDKAREYFEKKLFVSVERTQLALTVAKAQKNIFARNRPDSFSLYVSIPFCPSRCSYCSFVSHSITNANAQKLLVPYLKNLKREIEITGKIAQANGLRLESVYFGGGTPGILSVEEADGLIRAIEQNFDLTTNREYTFEAGRADVITREKLLALKQSGIDRVSINPQTYDDRVLCAIGRKHTAQQAIDAFNFAKEIGFSAINTDLIAGLPGDTVEGFCASLNQAIMLGAENITIHALALKRSSRLVAQENVDLNTDDTARRMVDYANRTLSEKGYIPYYMYRQSRCVGNLENVGWCLPGHECLYNVYMMEELHTVLAVGAGAVTKLKAPGQNHIERIFNFKYPYEYNSRFDELVQRKSRISEFYAEYNKEAIS